MSAKRKQGRRAELPEGMHDFAVDRETLMLFFHPPISKSKFYDLQKQGFIVPVSGVSGRYLLKLSLVRMGLPAVPDLPPLKKREKEPADIAPTPDKTTSDRDGEGGTDFITFLLRKHLGPDVPDDRLDHVRGVLDAGRIPGNKPG